MANPNSPFFSFSFAKSFSFACLLLLLGLLCSFKEGFALRAREIAESHAIRHTHTVRVSSLLPAATCSSSTTLKGSQKQAASLEVVHRHGPCAQLKGHEAKTPNHTQILLQDQYRVDSINGRLSGKGQSSGSGLSQTQATIPAKNGAVLGSGNYFVTVGLGTPKRDLSLIFDTGSDLTWTQCQPCVRACYNQKEPIFDPTKSSSYSNISCSSPSCSQLSSGTGNRPGCTGSACVYGIQYGDQSLSVGFFAKEKLTLTPSDVFDNFLFGCGENNQGLFGGTAGLLGLGRDKISIVKQTAQKYGQFFSYCLPSTSSGTGFLTFGDGRGSNVKYTPLSSISSGSSFYGLDILGISVAGTRLQISQSVFSTAGSIIDSGTVITRLPPTAYDALRSAFAKQMTRYPKAQALSILDTCYDFTGFSTVTFPKVGFFFANGVEVYLDASGILYVGSQSQVCLAFAGNSDSTTISIFGNTQQKTLKVVYDVSGSKLGFASGGCN